VSTPAVDELVEVAKVIEALTGVPPAIPVKMTREEKRMQAARVKRFLTLPPQLQEGALRYADQIRQAYRT